MINYYDVLQINVNADEAIVRAAYRTIMKTLCKHPDHGGDNQQAQVINEAYHNLIDPQKRIIYDQRLRKWKDTEGNDNKSAKENSRYFVIRCCYCSTMNRIDMSLLNKIREIRCGHCSTALKIKEARQTDINTKNLISNLEHRNWKVINNNDTFYDYKMQSDFFLKNYLYIKKVDKISPDNISGLADFFKNTFSRHITPIGHYFILIADKIEYLSFVIDEIKKYISDMNGWSRGIIIPIDLSRKQVFLSHVNLNHHPSDILKLRSFMFN